MTENQENNTDQMPNMDAIGLHLRRARQARKLEVEEVAAQLRLKEEIITALENDDLERLPAPIYTRGYIRSYAAKLGIESNKLIETYDKMIGEQSQHELTTLSNVKQYKLTDYRVLAVTAVIVVVLSSLFVVSWLEKPEQDMVVRNESATTNELPSSPKEEVVATDKEQSTVLDEERAVTETGSGVEVRQASLPDMEQQVTDTSQSDVAEMPGAESMPVTGESVSNEVKADTVNVEAEGEDKLELAFSDDCWIEVHDKQGKRLLFLMARKGKKYTLIGEAPFLVLLGNSPGVNVSINGEAFDQSAFNRGKVARFYVGG